MGLMGGGLAAMAVLAALTSGSDKKKVIYIEADMAEKGKKRKPKKDSGGSGGNSGDEPDRRFYPDAPWGGSSK